MVVTYLIGIVGFLYTRDLTCLFLKDLAIALHQHSVARDRS